MEDMFTFKELEPCYLKATYPIEIDERTFEKGDVLAKFDKIQVAGLESLYDIKTAHGGFSDRDFVFWETLKEINLIEEKIECMKDENEKLCYYATKKLLNND